MRSFLGVAVGAAILLGGSVAAHAAVFASQVISYNPGSASGTNPTLTDPTAALGPPSGLTGVQAGFPNVLSPFSPAFDVGQVVIIGAGGQLTLKFPQAISTAPGAAVGVISNVGLIDVNFPSGTAGTPASSFGGGSAMVSVSADGVKFVSLGVESFLNPANFYLNAGPYDAKAPTSPVLANFGTPFTGSAASFAGEGYSQVLQTLNGSGGGTWLDLSNTGLSQVNFIQFSVPTGGTGVAGTNGTRLPIDAVAVADSHLLAVVATPLPTGFAMAICSLMGLLVIGWGKQRLAASPRRASSNRA